ncbi:MAG: molybdopterin oxidoreductase family protein [Candidatus Scalindua sp. AMX11]|nr:MAG: molybdopterin oxidoreductase family protein [Candidatus Scalindua sp.]NOG83513.1 molybdopterin oxidoreductase family protein [Planctomycetota bacterium]RZV72081.1 MAG: molybdopterin oxidoreductase family protein [Candidatus Scalindua sp. SCAELEC01]TDE64368.1 MAG: molybdopterin oxidoreductase family protein [Candidatus Scalindua sp. AMX11]GJQ59885.1 MAG: putative oxidoreductase YoaE [Candidatus Scalindua sp.]
MIKKAKSVCPLDCPDTCGIISSISEGKLVKVQGDPDHFGTRGFLCKKVRHYPERVYGPDRLLYPLKRSGEKGSGSFERITWNEATEIITKKFHEIISNNGPESILPFSGSGTLGLVNGSVAGKRFFNRLGASRLDRTICSKGGRIGYKYTLGASLGADPLAIPRSKLIISWGTNPYSTNIHQIPLIQEAKRDGATYVVINPYKIKSVGMADLFLQPKPGSDAALALGVMNIIINNSLYDQDFVKKYTEGFEALTKRVQEYPLEKVVEVTGIKKEMIQEFAKLYAQIIPSFIYAGSGMQHHSNGGMMIRTISCLPGLVGAWKYPGGGMFYPTSESFPINWEKIERGDLSPNTPRSVNMNQLGEVLLHASPKIHGLYVYNSNPAAVLFNQRKVIDGLSRDDLFTVVHEQLFTDTVRYADIVLPATTQFEQTDLHYSYFHLSLQLNKPVIKPCGESRSNIDTFKALAQGMGFEETCFQETEFDIIKRALEIDSPYLKGISLNRLREGGVVRLTLPDDFHIPYPDLVFPTPSGKIEFYSERMKSEELDPLPSHDPIMEGPLRSPELYKKYPIYLLTPSAQAFLNSNFANITPSKSTERRPTLEIHSEDAKKRKIEQGDLLKVFNDRGECYLWAAVGENVREGVAVNTGIWWNSLSPGRCNSNQTTPDRIADLGGGSTYNTNLVQIEKVNDHTILTEFSSPKKNR